MALAGPTGRGVEGHARCWGGGGLGRWRAAAVFSHSFPRSSSLLSVALVTGTIRKAQNLLKQYSQHGLDGKKGGSNLIPLEGNHPVPLFHHPLPLRVHSLLRRGRASPRRALGQILSGWVGGGGKPLILLRFQQA